MGGKVWGGGGRGGSVNGGKVKGSRVMAGLGLWVVVGAGLKFLGSLTWF